MRRIALLALVVLTLQLSLHAAFPPHDGYVTDLAGILDAATEANLETLLTTLERETSAEVAVATVKSLDGMSVEEYANKLFAEWGIGKTQKDNGVLLLISTEERDLRIEVGYGLEGVLPDGLAGDIIRNTITPQFKAGNFPAGVTAGVTRISGVVRRDPASMAMGSDDSGDDGGPPPMFLIVPFFSIFIAIGAFVIGVGLRTKTIGSLIFGGMFAVMPFGMFAIFASGAWLAIMGTFGLAMMGLGFRKGGSPYWQTTMRDQKSGRDDGGWTMGSSGSGGSSSGGGSSSSGSSFGGGSSGGGGASGKW